MGVTWLISWLLAPDSSQRDWRLILLRALTKLYFWINWCLPTLQSPACWGFFTVEIPVQRRLPDWTFLIRGAEVRLAQHGEDPGLNLIAGFSPRPLPQSYKCLFRCKSPFWCLKKRPSRSSHCPCGRELTCSPYF